MGGCSYFCDLIKVFVICMCLYVHPSVCLYVGGLMQASLHVFGLVYVYVCLFVSMIYVCVYICINVCIYPCINVCMYFDFICLFLFY